MILSIADTFIRRPVLATVFTILILLVGGLCIPLLPVLYLPDIAPIQVNVLANYTGADAETVENTVTTILERQINGVEGMDYMTSTSSAGSSSISVYFSPDTNKDTNQVNVQNRLTQATPLLPPVVQQAGVITQASSDNTLMAYGVYSEKEEYDALFISNYLDLYVTDVLKRVPGVGKVLIIAEQKNAMRLWLNPSALASRGLTITDVTSALQSQNVAVGAGAIGQPPVPKGQSFLFPIRVNGRFKDTADFENLVIKTGTNGTLIRLKDVGRAEIGAESYDANVLIKDKPGVGIQIFQAPGSNAVSVAEAVEDRMEELEKTFPPGIKTQLIFSTTDFIEVSIEEVLHTLLEAFLLVVLVIFIFLQDWRTTIIPLIAIPVSLIGALAFAKVFGFSVNNLTLFGLILATGLVVDDAIIVVEAITAKMEQGLGARQATFEAMNELTGSIISMSLVLMAVFVPVAFFPGTTGKLYQQFALIIAFSIAVSCFNALSLSPSMSAILLRPHHGAGRGPLGWCFDKFNRFINWFIEKFRNVVNFLIRIRYVVLALFVASLCATFFLFKTVPTGFVPDEDQGWFSGVVLAPDGVSLEYSDDVVAQIRPLLDQEKDIATYLIASIIGTPQGIFFAKLTAWQDRPKPDQSVQAIIQRLNQGFSQIQTAQVIAYNPPAISGLGSRSGFEMQLQDLTAGKISIDEFLANAQEILAKANQNPAIAGSAYTQFTTGTPQLEIDFDRNKLEALNIDFQQALTALSTTIGSAYVNDFTLGTRSYKVFAQAEGDYRNNPNDINKIYVRSRDDKMIPLGNVATITPITGPSSINHYNGNRSISLEGQEAPGYSSGQALQVMDSAVEATALAGVRGDWVGLAKEQIAAGNKGSLIFLLGLIMVFLTLAAQYESYVDPVIILLTVPIALLGALGALQLRGLPNDVYAQVALVMLIGLAAKNAILIVEFANVGRKEGLSLPQAALQAAQERFRPIIMTAFAALAGFWPLVVASGAGAASRVSLGTALFGGLLLNTIVSLLLVPVLYVIIKKLSDRILGGGQKPKNPSHPEFEPDQLDLDRSRT